MLMVRNRVLPFVFTFCDASFRSLKKAKTKKQKNKKITKHSYASVI